MNSFFAVVVGLGFVFIALHVWRAIGPGSLGASMHRSRMHSIVEHDGHLDFDERLKTRLRDAHTGEVKDDFCP